MNVSTKVYDFWHMSISTFLFVANGYETGVDLYGQCQQA